MGAWGPGLYSNDFAADLRATVSALCRLPHDGDAILRLLVRLTPVASDESDEEHTTFWLVVADQFQRKGIESEARERAKRIIDNGANLKVLEQLDMAPSDLRKRAKALEELGSRLAEPPAAQARRTLKKPQPLLVQPGEVYVYPVDSRGNCYNPYVTDPTLAQFIPAGWSSCLVLEAAHALDYLAWYQIAPSPVQWADKPDLDEATRLMVPSENGVGTLPKSHLVRMQLELVGTITPPSVPRPAEERVISVVASDISASNILSRWLPEGSVPPRKRRWFGLGPSR